MCHLTDLEQAEAREANCLNLIVNCGLDFVSPATTKSVKTIKSKEIENVALWSPFEMLKKSRDYHYIKSLFKDPCNNYLKSQTSLLSTY